MQQVLPVQTGLYRSDEWMVQDRGGVLEDALGLEDVLEDTFWSPLALALALASKPQVLETWPVLGSRTALFFEPLKFCWKTPENFQKICKYLFCFPHLEHRLSQGGGGGQGTRPPPPPQFKFHHWQKCDKKVYCFFSFVLAFFADNSN